MESTQTCHLQAADEKNCEQIRNIFIVFFSTKCLEERTDVRKIEKQNMIGTCTSAATKTKICETISGTYSALSGLLGAFAMFTTFAGREICGVGSGASSVARRSGSSS